MKKLRALMKTWRFLLPVTLVLEELGVIRVFPRAGVSEALKIRGSLSSRELSTLIADKLEIDLSGGCEFSIRRSERSMEIPDSHERRLLSGLGVDVNKLIKENSRIYRDIYIVKIVKNGDVHTVIVDRRTAVILGKYLAKYCEEKDVVADKPT